MDNLERIKELEAELAEAKRRAAWYLSLAHDMEFDKCDVCEHVKATPTKSPCKSCSEWFGDKDNFTPAPVPADFEVKENG